MRHVQFHIADIFLGPRPLPIKHGTVQIVERGGVVDWEIVLVTVESEPVGEGVHPLELRAITGASDTGTLELTELNGEAGLVRWVESSLVFRGAGSLAGFADEFFPS